jgi:hypothetical protein
MKRQMQQSFPRLFLSSVALLVLLCASALLARPGILKTNAGQTYNGDIKDNGDSYTITVDKIDSQIPKSDVASVTYTGSIDDQFNQRMTNLDAKDAEGRVKLARFAFDNGRNELAAQALSAALRIDPNNADAIDMLKTVQAQRNLEHTHSASGAPGPGASAGASPEVPDTGAPPEVMPAGAIAQHLLTAKDINSIKQHELRPDEDITVSIPTDVKRKFAAKIGVPFSQFDALAPMDQFNQILQKGDGEMKAAMKIGRDPQAILQFKRLIQPMVLRNCATSGCHGGTAGGKFILYNGTDTATTYTNFYIMEQFSMKTGASAGFFGGNGDRKMIERGDGAHSLLINFGLPIGQGDVSHPKIPNSGFIGIFHTRDDRLYRDRTQL